MEIKNRKSGGCDDDFTITGTNAIKRNPGYNQLTGTSFKYKPEKSGSLDPQIQKEYVKIMNKNNKIALTSRQKYKEVLAAPNLNNESDYEIP